MNPKSRLRSILFAACALIGLSGPLCAQSKFFLYSLSHKAQFKGGTQHVDYKDKKAAEILSFSFGAENTINIGSITGGGAAGKATFQELSVQFVGEPDMMPWLFEMLTTGAHVNDMVIEEASTNAITSKSGPSLKIDMRLVMMQNLQAVGTQGDRTIYNATFQFGAVEITTMKMDDTGKMVPASSYKWSQVKNNNSLEI